MSDTFTTNYGFTKIDFNSRPWHTREYANWDMLDSILASILKITNFKGNWQNSTAYTVGQRVFDATTQSNYEVLVNHTSAASPTTFAGDRITNPTYWRQINSAPYFRGPYVPGTTYYPLDVVSNANIFYSCLQQHVGGAILDVTKWSVIVDLTGSALPAPALADANKVVIENTTGTGYTTVDHAQLRGFTNKLINGQFDIFQRGASVSCPAGSRTFLADRWYVNPTGAAITQQSTTGAPPPNAKTKNQLLLTGAVGATTVLIGQRIEAAEMPPLATTVTFQAWIYNNSGAPIVPVLLLGTPAAADDFTTVTNKLTQALQNCPNAAFTQVSFTVDMSAYANILNGLQVEIQLPNGSMSANTKTVYFAEADLHVGSSVVTFVRRPLSVELGLCLPFFEKSYDLNVAPGTITQAGRIGLIGATAGFFSAATSGSLYAQFKCRKRAVPSVSIYATFTGTINKVSDPNPVDRSATVTAGEQGITVTYTDAVAAAGMLFHFAAAAEL